MDLRLCQKCHSGSQRISLNCCNRAHILLLGINSVRKKVEKPEGRRSWRVLFNPGTMRTTIQVYIPLNCFSCLTSAEVQPASTSDRRISRDVPNQKRKGVNLLGILYFRTGRSDNDQRNSVRGADVWEVLICTELLNAWRSWVRADHTDTKPRDREISASETRLGAKCFLNKSKSSLFDG